MAIDDNTNYTLTGEQVKDLAARIKASGGGMIVYVDASFESPSSITNVFSDSGLTTVADWEDMADVILAGGTVIAVYDNGSNKHQYVELVSVTVNDNIPFGKRFAGVISSNVGEGSKPLTIFLYYDDGIVTPRWFAEGASLPTVNDAMLTIQKNGTTVQTFTANQSTNATANITVPTQFSDLSGTISTSQIADGAVTGAKLDGDSYSLTNTPAHSFGTNSYTLYRVGNIVIFNADNIWQTEKPAANTWTEIGTLPVAIRPASGIARGIFGMVNGSNGLLLSAALVEVVNGVIRCKPPTASTANLTGWTGNLVWKI